MASVDNSEKVNEKIKEINEKIRSGEISLLDHELVPIFNEIKSTLTISNLKTHSKSFQNACSLLDLKFKELEKLLKSLNSEQKFFDFLKSDPEDFEISKLFQGCWIKPFTVNSLSMNFLSECKEKLCTEKQPKKQPPPPPEKEPNDEIFTLEIPSHNFNEKMLDFYEEIKVKFPCPFDDIFEEQKDQLKLFENFVYLLYLFQLGKIKYQKETEFLYID